MEWRATWASIVNAALLRAGHEVRIDHRSHAARGIALEATTHRGVHASGMRERGIETERSLEEVERQARNVAYLTSRPAHILHIVADKRAVFTEADVAQELLRYIPDRDLRERLLEAAMGCDDLVMLADAVVDPETAHPVDVARYTTRDMLSVEREMADRAVRMAGARGFGVGEGHVERALAAMNETLGRTGGALSLEQETAIRAVTAEGALRAVVGLAGTGKSTMLEAARVAWEAAGYRVRGVALAGKAVAELQAASGIRSRTIASLQVRLDRGRELFRKGDILVVDEAGMVGSAQLAHLLRAAEAGGAKVVLVGDPDQLQPISAGAGFRAIIERVGFTEIAGIRRQTADWMRAASVDFARGRVAQALEAYADHGAARGYRRKATAIAGMARAILRDRARVSSVLGLAHSNRDVRAINDAVRAERRAAGALQDEMVFRSSRGARGFAEDDRIVFLQNDAGLGVKNGMLGTVTGHAAGRLRVRVDGGPEISFGAARYPHVDHGYAVTVHKSQGATVDSVHVLATRSITRNLAYVAMTRHRERAALHYARASFAVFEGGLVEAMSRPDAKASTLDYVTGIAAESAIAFGERRGFASRMPVARTVAAILGRQAQRVADLFARFVRLAPVAASDREWLLAPETGSGTDVARLARERALASDALATAERDLKAIASEVFRDADAAMRQFRGLLDRPRDAVQDMTHRLHDAPESIGALRGATGFLAGRAARDDRAAARDAIVPLRRQLRAFRSTFGSIEAAERLREFDRNERLAVGVPALTPREAALLDRLDIAARAGEAAFAAALDAARRKDPGALTRIAAFRDALERRVGHLGRFLARSETETTEVARADRRLLETHRPRLEQVRRVAGGIEARMRRDRALGRGLKR